MIRKLVVTTISVVALMLLSSVAYSQACTGAGSILTAKTNTIGPFDFVIFTLKKPLNSNYSYAVTTVISTGTFTEQPSGNPVTITGPRYKKIVFQGIEWMCEITENFVLPKTAVKDVKKLEQHEGVVTYVVGRRIISPFVAHYTYPAGSNTQKVVMAFRH